MSNGGRVAFLNDLPNVRGYLSTKTIVEVREMII